MSRKSKRQVRRNTSSANGTSTPGAPAYQRPGEFNPDYTYVIKDLRRIGVLAGTFITILVVLSFFLR